MDLPLLWEPKAIKLLDLLIAYSHAVSYSGLGNNFIPILVYIGIVYLKHSANIYLRAWVSPGYTCLDILKDSISLKG